MKKQMDEVDAETWLVYILQRASEIARREMRPSRFRPTSSACLFQIGYAAYGWLAVGWRTSKMRST